MHTRPSCKASAVGRPDSLAREGWAAGAKPLIWNKNGHQGTVLAKLCISRPTRSAEPSPLHSTATRTSTVTIFTRTTKTVTASAAIALAATAAGAAVVNGSFEEGPRFGPPTGWTDTDTVWGFSRSSDGLSMGASEGRYFIWYGMDIQAQTARQTQNAVIEASAGFLLFDFWARRSNASDFATFTFSIDSTVLFTVGTARASDYSGGYRTISVPLGGFADGLSHSLSFAYSDRATTRSGALTSWSFDNVRLAPRIQAIEPDLVPVPVPGTLALVGAALVGFGALRRRRA